MHHPILIRISEYGRVDTGGILTDHHRAVLSESVERWREEHHLNRSPLRWEGIGGRTLCAAQYVGVVETGDVVIEIYPKLDKATLDTNEVGTGIQNTLLQNLLWMMEVAEVHEPPETDTGGLEESPESFLDVWALLFARRLLSELRRGMIRRYVHQEDDLHMVRGRILMRQQAGRLSNRFDKIACAWDEFTNDISLNRVLRCACRVLSERVRGILARRLLDDCLLLLDEVTDVPIATALSYAHQQTRFDRTAERFALSYALAVRLLQGFGHTLQSAQAQTFVFFVDMNAVWEGYVEALLTSKFGTAVKTQSVIGYLFPEVSPGGIQQKPDYYLRDSFGNIWIGDAKYKHLTKNQTRPLRFADIDSATGEQLAGRVISPDDTRQLTVYAEMDARKRQVSERAQLLLLYPYVGTEPLQACSARTWNETTLWLVPVAVTRTITISDNLPIFP